MAKPPRFPTLLGVKMNLLSAKEANYLTGLAQTQHDGKKDVILW